MLGQLLAITRNTFFESIRQPVVLVILTVACLLLLLSNPLSAFTMDSDQRMLVDIGLATVFLGATLLSAFIATGVLSREIENRTVLTIVSKPVPRPIFVLGKYFGVAGAILISTLLMSLVFLIVEIHSVLETVRDPVHLPAIIFGTLAIVLGVGTAIWCNYFYGKVFSSTAIVVTTPLLALAYLFTLFFDHDFRPQDLGTDFKGQIWLALACMTVAVMILTAIAIAASARLGQLMTLAVTFGMFLLGLLSDWLVGRRIHVLNELWLSRARTAGQTETIERVRSFELVSGEIQRSLEPELIDQVREGVSLSSFAEGWETMQYAFWKALYACIPNLQSLWLTDAITQSHRIPLSYVRDAALYGSAYVIGALALGVVLFQRREVG